VILIGFERRAGGDGWRQREGNVAGFGLAHAGFPLCDPERWKPSVALVLSTLADAFNSLACRDDEVVEETRHDHAKTKL